eukprot:CAMPEP_0177757076 /NCGR_PEP_ID=MMETSP0491_2-20121128/3452_1 /TAXON_ID=63592 /ORGANISM="Tetraselmis chuii, Strain PLY429" /LENGTH=595 /DNA_ID=CAMNT_0019272707 /DNA_START=132 /DNA_END=1916 /DNA_ORIENTATION=+
MSAKNFRMVPQFINSTADDEGLALQIMTMEDNQLTTDAGMSYPVSSMSPLAFSPLTLPATNPNETREGSDPAAPAMMMAADDPTDCFPMMSRLDNFSHSPLAYESFPIGEAITEELVDEQSHQCRVIGVEPIPAPSFHQLSTPDRAPSSLSVRIEHAPFQAAIDESRSDPQQLLFEVAARDGTHFGAQAPLQHYEGMIGSVSSRNTTFANQHKHNHTTQQHMSRMGRFPLQTLNPNVMHSGSAAAVNAFPGRHSSEKMAVVREPRDVSPLERRGLPPYDMAQALACSPGALSSLKSNFDDSPSRDSKQANADTPNFDDYDLPMVPSGAYHNSNRGMGCLLAAASLPCHFISSSPPGRIYQHYSPSGPRILSSPTTLCTQNVASMKREVCETPHVCDSDNNFCSSRVSAAEPHGALPASTLATKGSAGRQTVCAQLEPTNMRGIQNQSDVHWPQLDKMHPIDVSFLALQQLASAAVGTSNVARSCRKETARVPKLEQQHRVMPAVPPLSVLPDSPGAAGCQPLAAPMRSLRNRAGALPAGSGHTMDGLRPPLASIENTTLRATGESAALVRRGRDAQRENVSRGFGKKAKKRGSSR